MKKQKFCTAVIAVFLAVFLCSCSLSDYISLKNVDLFDRFFESDEDVNIPADHLSYEVYTTSDHHTPFLSYGKYLYESPKGMDYRVDKTNYAKAMSADLPTITAYFRNFAEQVKESGELEGYDFDISCISIKDIFYIKTNAGHEKIEGAEDGEVYGEFESYTVYFFDRQSNTLYTIHTEP